MSRLAPSPAPPGTSRPRIHQVLDTEHLLTDLLPARGRFLEVGSGDGLLCRALARRPGRLVVGVEPDRACVELSRRLGGGVSYLHADFLSLELRPGAWDVILAMASLHHMDLEAALLHIRRLLRPGGVFVAVGLARSGLADLPLDAAGRLLRPLLTRQPRSSGSPAPQRWPPPHTYGQVRRLAAALLPGVRYRRHLLHRYSLIWRKPETQPLEREATA